MALYCNVSGWLIYLTYFHYRYQEESSEILLDITNSQKNQWIEWWVVDVEGEGKMSEEKCWVWVKDMWFDRIIWETKKKSVCKNVESQICVTTLLS